MTTQSAIFLPEQRNPFFTGRETVLQHLRAVLCQQRVVALSGPAGMGKTALALEYAWRFAQEYRRILWLDAASSETLLADIIELAPRLSLAIPANEQNLAYALPALQEWLASQQQYLLLLANVAGATPAAISASGHGHVLLLTRAPVADPSLAQLKLSTLDEQDGALLLLRQTGQITPDGSLEQAAEEVRAGAAALAHELAGLPIALHLAAAYIKATGGSIQEYLTMYRDYATRLVQLKVSKDRCTDAIAITCSLPAIYLKRAHPLAAELLWLCTVLAHTAIPQDLFSQGAAELVPELQEVAHNPVLLDEALVLLHSFGLVTAQETTRTLSMPSMVRETLYQAQPLPKQQSLVEQALRALYHLLPVLEQAAPAVRLRTTVHIQRLAALSSIWTFSSEPIADVFCWAASLLWERQLIQEAEMLLRRALAIWERTLGFVHPTVGIVLQNLVTLNALLKNYPEAEALSQRALLVHARALGVTDPAAIGSLLDLARIYRVQGKTREAQACYQEALKIGAYASIREQPLLATASCELAALYAEEEKYQQAEVYYQRALALYETAPGLEDSRVQECLAELAAVYLQQEKLAEAEEVLQRLLTAKERALGTEHADIMPIVQKIALLELALEKWGQAEQAYERLLAFYEHTPGQEYADLLSCLEQVAMLSTQQNRFEQAESVLQRALNIREQVLGVDHPDVAATLVKLAELYLARHDPEAAEPLLQRALISYTQGPAPDLVAISIILENLAVASVERGETEQAASLSESARALREQVLDS